MLFIGRSTVLFTQLNLRQVAVIAGNLELADVIQLHKPEDIGELHCGTLF